MGYNETPIRKPIPRSNYPTTSSGGMVPRAPVGAIMHHIVGTLPGCTAHFQNPNTGYATNYGIGSTDGRGGGDWEIHEYVPAEYVAWGNGNTHLNEAGVSIEHENDLRIAINGKPRPEVHELSARFLARLAVQFDWRIDGKLQLIARDFPNHDYYGKKVTGFGTEFNVITHRSVALKDCPKDLDYAWIVYRANQIIQAGPAGLGYNILDLIEEGETMFIRKPDGAWLIADAFGVENIANLTDDPTFAGITKQNLIAAAEASERVVKLTDQAEADHLQMILRRRGAQNLAAIRLQS